MAAEVPIPSYLHLAPDNLNGPKLLSNKECLAQLSKLEHKLAEDTTGDVYLRPVREPLYIPNIPRTSRQRFVKKPGSDHLTKMPHKHTWGEEVIAEARKHERAQMQPGWIRRIPIIDVGEDNHRETTSIPVQRVYASLGRLIVVSQPAEPLTDGVYFGENGRFTTTIRKLLEEKR